jgi:outer membrane immunogenic protein
MRLRVQRPTQQDLHMKTLLLGAGAALMLMTSNALADGMPRGAPAAICCEPNWTGFYIGVGGGGAFTQHQHSARLFEERNYGYATVVDAFRLWDLDNGRSHAFGTVTVGYDHLLRSHWVAGIFVDYDFGNGKDDSRILQIRDFSNVQVSNDFRHAWSIGGRLGFLSSPNTLLYLSTGWTQVSVDRDVSFWLDGTPHNHSFDKDRDGWFIGAGMETQLGWLHPGLSLRGEYRFTRLDDEHRRLDLGEAAYCGVPVCTMNRRLEFDHDIDVHSVRVVLAYKFGRREAAPVPLK